MKFNEKITAACFLLEHILPPSGLQLPYIMPFIACDFLTLLILKIDHFSEYN